MSQEQVFRCQNCQAYVSTSPLLSGVRNRNHCPYCLWSRHVDLLLAGDRLSACKAIMQPIGLTVKSTRNKYGNGHSGELMLIHRCNDCGKLSINRIAADDFTDRLLDVFHASAVLGEHIRHQLAAGGILLLGQADRNLVFSQLHGMTVQ